MSGELENLEVLGIPIAFKSGADMERAKLAATYVTEQYEAQKQRSQGKGKDILLTFLVLGLADELLQMKSRQMDVEKRLAILLEKIEKSRY